jgi:NAD(P)-dependent dehydrogenase (short-subunit alcohol dehydrogenase family)
MLLEDRVAIVTGAASGIGLATAQRFAEEGARLVLVDIVRDGLDAAAAGMDAQIVSGDVSDPATLEAAVQRALDEYGHLDVAFLNAGRGIPAASIVDLTGDDYRRIFGTNVEGVLWGIRASVPAMSASGGGAIVLTASVAGLDGDRFASRVERPPGLAPRPAQGRVVPAPNGDDHRPNITAMYGITKYAVVGMARKLANELAGWGVTINAICPYAVDTPILRSVRERLIASGETLIPVSQIAQDVLDIARSGKTGEAWICAPGRAALPHEFPELRDSPSRLLD